MDTDGWIDTLYVYISLTPGPGRYALQTFESEQCHPAIGLPEEHLGSWKWHGKSMGLPRDGVYLKPNTL